jgi:hypothetical protein
MRSRKDALCSGSAPAYPVSPNSALCRAIREAITLIRALLRGEQVDMHGDVISFLEGRLGFNTNAH